ncbi:peptide ABC transporter substrate-binding protein [Thiotrichales bacterium 19S9-12]|nr:peptide ABC transporter substrate-binding protein [Thiotrichales bacterium 19S9-11]MCF6810857.1 peptide ABC transporter substrate-binding protein [Thiotrichales bacterium 19S9-12]
MKLTNKKITLNTMLISAAIALSACSNNQSVEKNTDSKYAPKDKDTFVRANGAEPESLDPAKAQTTTASAILYDLFEGLVSETQTNQPAPGVAKSWKVSNDGKTYTFYLRDDAKWSNGKVITADDFVYSLRRAVNPKTASPMAYKLGVITNANDIMASKKSVETLGVKAIDLNTLEISLNDPTYYFLGIMADPVAYPVYKPSVDQYGQSAFQQGKLISNGAYKLQSWVVNGHILLEKNPYYWDAKDVKIAKVKFLPIVSETSALSAYAAGNVDFTQYIPVDGYHRTKTEYGNQLHTAPLLSMTYVDFNMTQPPFKDNLKLREALSLVINRKLIADKVLKQGQEPLYAYFPAEIDNGVYNHVNYPWATWSMEKRIKLAKKLYAEAGYSRQNPLKISYIYNTSDKNRKIAETLAAMWHKTLGVETSIENSEWKVFLYTRQNKDYHGTARDAWVADFNTIDNFATMWMCHNPQNNSGYCNPNYDLLIKKAQNTANTKAREDYYQQSQGIVMNEYNIIPLFSDQIAHLVKPYVTGYNMQSNHLDHIYDKWLSFRYEPTKLSKNDQALKTKQNNS